MASSAHHTSTSALGSVKGKKLGRNRIFASRAGPSLAPKKAFANAVSMAFRSAKLTPSSTTSPSTWWNRQ